MAIYLDFAGFKSLTVIPSKFVDEVEAVSPGWVDTQLDYWSRWIDSRLRKRYASPFAAFGDAPPTPLAVQGWLVRIVTIRVWIKRGIDPNDLQYDTVNQDSIDAKTEIAEAADSNVGLFDLPLRVDQDGSAINRANPKSHTEASPYVWTDEQADTARLEDEVGRGTDG